MSPLRQYIAEFINHLICCYNHNTVSDLQMIVTIGDDHPSLSSDAGDQIISLRRQVLQRNIRNLTFLFNNEFQRLYSAAQKLLHCLHVCTGIGIIPGNNIAHDFIRRSALCRNDTVNPHILYHLSPGILVYFCHDLRNPAALGK